MKSVGCVVQIENEVMGSVHQVYSPYSARKIARGWAENAHDSVDEPIAIKARVEKGRVILRVVATGSLRAAREFIRRMEPVD